MGDWPCSDLVWALGDLWFVAERKNVKSKVSNYRRNRVLEQLTEGKMNYMILGLVLLILGIGTLQYSRIVGSVTSIIGLGLMMKGKKDLGNGSWHIKKGSGDAGKLFNSLSEKVVPTRTVERWNPLTAHDVKARNMNYQSPNEILDELIMLFPGFQVEWNDENSYIEEDGSFNLSAVYMTFLPYLSGRIDQFNNQQIERLARLINAAVDAGRNSENAVSTCFLEHVGQVGLYRILKPLLSKEARKRLHA